jgi:hypothetical protein
LPFGNSTTSKMSWRTRSTRSNKTRLG